MVDEPWASRVRLPPTRWLVGLGAAFAIGLLVLPIGGLAHAELALFAVVGPAGFVGVIVRPGWPGFLGSAAGLTAYVTILAAAARFSGLHCLLLAFMLPALGVGAAVGTIVNRTYVLGAQEALPDRGMWGAAVAGVGLACGLAWLYITIVPSDSPP